MSTERRRYQRAEGVGAAGDRAESSPEGQMGMEVAFPARTPPNPVPVPEVREGGQHELDDPAYYLNRELTWLNFNFRVLHEASDTRTPLLERIRFISIVGSNIDEFFMKRIGGLKQQVGAGLLERSVDGMTAEEQIARSYEVVRTLEDRQREAWEAVQAELAEVGVALLTYPDLTDAQREELREHYLRNVFPLVTPQATDPAHPFPFVSNLSLNLLVSLRYPGEPVTSLARVKVPVGAGIPRLLQLQDTYAFVALEEVMANNLDLLFPGMEVDDCELFRVTRNANTELEEEGADDLLALIETGLRERKFAPIVRIEIAPGMQPIHRGRLAAELGLDEQADVFEVPGLLAMRDLAELTELKLPAASYPPHQPADHPALKDDDNVFHVIRNAGPMLVHHPYHSFATSVERFLQEASSDPKVRAIKMTMYRTSDDSKAIRYLIDAARNGKQVAVVLELKARFDEEANIRWANYLEERGVHVTYGVMGLKTHSKAILVVRQDYDRLRRYAHVGTGNYHAGTARLYTDLGLFTSDEEIGHDLTELFNYLTTGYKPKRNYLRILPAPKTLKPELLSKILREIAVHTKDVPGRIQFKLNALEDVDVTRALYQAAQTGVQVDLLIRDTCRLRPGIPGLSENVRVVSIVGRFLEHSRIYYFRNGGDEEYYIGSADCMKRNLDSRVEILAPVDDAAAREELRFILDAGMNDDRNGWEMSADGSYRQRRPRDEDRPRACQQLLVDRAEKQLRAATRLRRRKPRGIPYRNVG